MIKIRNTVTNISDLYCKNYCLDLILGPHFKSTVNAEKYYPHLRVITSSYIFSLFLQQELILNSDLLFIPTKVQQIIEETKLFTIKPIILALLFSKGNFQYEKNDQNSCFFFLFFLGNLGSSQVLNSQQYQDKAIFFL